jgi:hypothetical protein
METPRTHTHNTVHAHDTASNTARTCFVVGARRSRNASGVYVHTRDITCAHTTRCTHQLQHDVTVSVPEHGDEPLRLSVGFRRERDHDRRQREAVRWHTQTILRVFVRRNMSCTSHTTRATSIHTYLVLQQHARWLHERICAHSSMHTYHAHAQQHTTHTPVHHTSHLSAPTHHAPM